jgi:NADH:ubiquinone oxidoreductase subunit F (NADH-binding)
MRADALCVFSREGAAQVYRIVADIAEGRGEADDVELLRELLLLIASYANCDISKQAAAECLTLLEDGSEWEYHISRKCCPKEKIERDTSAVKGRRHRRGE